MLKMDGPGERRCQQATVPLEFCHTAISQQRPERYTTSQHCSSRRRQPPPHSGPCPNITLISLPNTHPSSLQHFHSHTLSFLTVSALLNCEASLNETSREPQELYSPDTHSNYFFFFSWHDITSIKLEFEFHVQCSFLIEHDNGETSRD